MNPLHPLNPKAKKIIALVIALLLLPLAGLTAFGQTDSGDPITPDTPKEHDQPHSYGHYSGTVTEIIPFTSQNDAYHVVIETDEISTEEGERSPIWFTVTSTTVFFSDQRPNVGDTVSGFYDLQAPMLMIYPPQYQAVAMAVNPGDTHTFVGHFDEDLVDADNRLMLVIVEETLVQLPDGTPYEGSLKNQVLAVAYGASTRSIPAQTRPEKVIVIPAPEADEDEAEQEVEAGQKDEAEDMKKERAPLTAEDWMPPVETAPIVVEDQVLANAPAPFVTDNNVIMVPLKQIGEALGYNVTWSAELRVVMLSDSFTVAIGQDSYVDMSKDEPIALGTAPVIRENRTFVPLHFFRDVIPMNNVYYFEHQIDINNQEKMH